LQEFGYGRRRMVIPTPGYRQLRSAIRIDDRVKCQFRFGPL
jgi:hypothetical protein